MHSERLIHLQDALGHRFRDVSLLEMALVHASTLAARNNERLEFLGDRVLALVMTQYLYATHPLDKEGELSKRLNNMVRRQSIAAVARHVHLDQFLAASAAPSEAMLADAMEAVLGAVFLDAGYQPVRDVIVDLWQKAIGSAESATDAKTALQEWAQGKGLPLPEYTQVSRAGTDHAPEFTVRVTVKTLGSAEGTGNSKRAAEKLAAQELLKKADA
jgi:ribonuclease-3